MKNKLFISLVLLSSLAFVPSAFAATPGLTNYTLLEPLPYGGNNESVTSVTAETFIPGLFRLILAIASVLAVVRLIYAGIIYMSSDAYNKKNEAKTIIQDALWGLGLAMGAWIIVATILGPQALTFNLSLQTTPITNPPTGGGGTGGGGSPSSLTQADVLRQFQGKINVIGPIQLAGLQQITINELLRLKNECNCFVGVTSATGGSHEDGKYSHENGYKVDLRSKDEGAVLLSHIQKYPPLPDRTGAHPAKMYQAPSGAKYAVESDHIDVVVGG
jgi:hypothetical protein